jgi:hypothetical protein
MTVRTVLHVEDVVAWAEEHRQRTGKLPTAKSGVVVAKPDEKWGNLDSALHAGLRGFRRGWSLPKLLAEYCGHRNRKQLSKYTIKTILDWADDHKQRTGDWPTSDSGAIEAAPGETWLAVSMALSHGRRGFRGGSSLALLLAERRGVRHRLLLSKLSHAEILKWAGAFKKKTGNWPTEESGPIPESPGDTWLSIDKALRRGRRGLRGRYSLSRLLADRRGVTRHVRKPPLSFEQILVWADAYKKRRGRWPKANSGRIKGTGETWYSVQKALYAGKRGLPAGWSLARLFAEYRGVRNHLGLPQLSESKILKWIKAYIRRHGKMPTSESGPIDESRGETWCGVNMALRQGGRGLKRGGSLAQLKRKFL